MIRFNCYWNAWALGIFTYYGYINNKGKKLMLSIRIGPIAIAVII